MYCMHVCPVCVHIGFCVNCIYLSLNRRETGEATGIGFKKIDDEEIFIILNSCKIKRGRRHLSHSRREDKYGIYIIYLIR